MKFQTKQEFDDRWEYLVANDSAVAQAQDLIKHGLADKEFAFKICIMALAEQKYGLLNQATTTPQVLDQGHTATIGSESR